MLVSVALLPDIILQVPMDAMKALASLDLVTARGLDSSDQGPQMLANSVSSVLISKYNRKDLKLHEASSMFLRVFG